MTTVKICDVGGSPGIFLPPDMVERMNLKPGDILTLVETLRGFELSPLEGNTSEQMKVAARIIQDNKNLLSKLAD